MNNCALLQAVLQRHSVRPKYLAAPAPSLEVLTNCAKAALRAPDHGLLSPCRFVWIPEEKRAAVGELFAAAAQRQGSTPERVERARSKALKGAGMVACIARIQKDVPIPEEEQLLTAGAALDQFLLALDAQGFGGIILSGRMLQDRELQTHFAKTDQEKMIGWIIVGTPQPGFTPDPDTRDVPLSVWEG